MITRIPVQSSNLVSIGHCPQSNVLEIEFKGGGVYRYAGVSKDDHARLMAAPSIGTHFHGHIKHAYAVEKMR